MLAKLAFGNMRKLMHDYAVYFLTLVLGVAVFYAFNTISVQGRLSVAGDVGETLKQVGEILARPHRLPRCHHGLPHGVREQLPHAQKRKKELGLYQVLGMRAGQVNAILTLETLMVALVSFMGSASHWVPSSRSSCSLSRQHVRDEGQHFRSSSPPTRWLTFFCFAVTFVVMMVFNWHHALPRAGSSTS
jgi:putative ABC transport system permease protein